MIFGSWVYTSKDITLDYFEEFPHADLTDYVPSGTWDLLEVPASIVNYTDPNSNNTRVYMVYKVKIKRKSLFYIINIVIPAVSLTILTICVFYLPTGDGEKINLSLSVLFSLGNLENYLSRNIYFKSLI